MWMAEAAELIDAIGDALGETARGMRPLRAGDYSFNQIGPSAFYMPLSNIPKAEREARGYYAVGGCGGSPSGTPRRMGRAWRMATSFVAICRYSSRRSSGRSTRRSIPSTTARRSLKLRLRSESIRSRRRAPWTWRRFSPTCGAARRRCQLDRRGGPPDAGGARRSRAPPAVECDAAPARPHPGPAQLRARRAVRPRSGDQAPAVPRLEAAALVTDAAPAIRPFILPPSSASATRSARCL